MFWFKSVEWRGFGKPLFSDKVYRAIVFDRGKRAVELKYFNLKQYYFVGIEIAENGFLKFDATNFLKRSLL